MKYSLLAFAILVLTSCGETPQYRDFMNLAPGKTEKNFHEDSGKCEADKNMHSSKIRGRELGFKGRNTAYLGCMQEKGWEQKRPELY